MAGKKSFNHQKIEKKWQRRWKQTSLYRASEKASNKEYILVELAYTSGDLHIGHWFGWTAPDVYARFRRMNGANVLFPVGGFDSFGLPAENAAIKHGVHPKKWTERNINNMRSQFETMGPSFDWDAEVTTSDPEYYRWTQWLFLQMYAKNLAYKDKVSSNWCPKCKTVLANEHVENGCCWRHTDTKVKQKKVDQWLFRITDYADRLIWPKNPKVSWPRSMVEGQNNWIGRSEGVLIEFPISNFQFPIRVFTTRPDTIYGATFMILAPEHPLVLKITTEKQLQKVKKYIKESQKKLELDRLQQVREKTGVFTGAYATNPMSKKKIPIWISDFVLMEYGTGAIMGVPAHDQRDMEFAKRNKLNIITVLEPITGEVRKNEEFRRSIVALVRNPRNGKLLSINWGSELGGNLFVGGGRKKTEDSVECAKREILEEAGYENVKFIAKSEKVHHHYYASSKKVDRYIEAVGLYFELVDQERDKQKLEKDEVGKFKVEWITEAEADEKVNDPLHRYIYKKFVKGNAYDGQGIAVNSGTWNGLKLPDDMDKVIKDLERKRIGNRETTYHLRDWSISRQRYWGAPIPIVYCDECGTVPVPEEDLPVKLPEKVDYSPTGKAPLATAENWVRVACPECGKDARRETETMDTYVDSSWYIFRYPNPKYKKGPFEKRLIKKWMPVSIYFGGPEHILGHTLYARFITKVLQDWGLIDFDEFAKVRYNHGIILGPDGFRMSKSRGNVVNPDIEVNKYGADAVRLYLCFLGPHNQGGPWIREGIEGMSRFLQRVWRLVTEKQSYELTDEGDINKLIQIKHKTIQKVSEDISKLKFNTAIAALMEFSNFLQKKSQKNVGKRGLKDISKEWSSALETIILLLAPFAPHLAEEAWVGILGNKFSVHKASWPKHDPKLVIEDEVEIPVQVNGKLRGTIKLKTESSKQKDEVIKAAKEEEKVKKWIEGKKIKKEIFVPGKLVNFVVKN